MDIIKKHFQIKYCLENQEDFIFTDHTAFIHCLNIVTDKNNFASGVLIRAVSISNENERLASGPGLVTRAFEVDKN